MFLRLLVQKHGVLPLIVGGFLISEDIAYETVIGLFRVGFVLVFLPPVKIFKLLLQGILDLYVSLLPQTHIPLSLQHILLGLSLLGVVDYFVLEVFVSEPLLVVYVLVIVVYFLVLLVFLVPSPTVLEKGVLVFYVFYVLFEVLLLLSLLLSRPLLSLPVEGRDHIFSDFLCPFLLLHL